MLVTESFLPQVNGVTNSVCRAVEHLAGRGHTVEVVAPTGPASFAGAPVEHTRGVRLPLYDGFTLGVSTRRSLRRSMIRFRPDIVHVASPFLLGAAAISAARSLGVPTVSIYQTDLVGFARNYRLSGAAPLLERMTRRVHERADRTLVPSAASESQLRALGVPRLRTWPRGVDAERFTPDRRDAGVRRRLLGTPADHAAEGDDVLVGYVGRMAREKCLHHLAAIQDLPRVRMVMVGDGPELDRLRRALPRARFLGARYDDELADLMAALDVFVHPGAEETFCQAVQEAQASGVPAIGPAAGGLADRIHHGVTGLHYARGDLPQMRAAVRRVVDDPALRRSMGRAARTAVIDRSWSVVNEALVGHYREVVDGGVPPAGRAVRRGTPYGSPDVRRGHGLAR